MNAVVRNRIESNISDQIQLTWRNCPPNVMSAVVFSKDRAMQLQALLSSFFETKIGHCDISVIYKSSTSAHQKAYMEVAAMFEGEVTFIREDAFKNLKQCLATTISRLPVGKMFFLVDDIIFTEPVDYESIAALDLSNTVFSLRMGDHLDFSYVVESRQPLPKFVAEKDGYLWWRWRESEFDWGYPLSVDGHVFSTAEVSLWIQHLEFASPSSFENSLQVLKSIYFKKMGMSFKKARIVNIPANKVQNEVENLHGSIHQNLLLEQWQKGMSIDHTKFRGLVNRSVHQEAEFHLIQRR